MMLSQGVVAGGVSRLIIRQSAVTVSASETESQRREGCGVLQLLDWTRWKMVPSITYNVIFTVWERGGGRVNDIMNDIFLNCSYTFMKDTYIQNKK